MEVIINVQTSDIASSLDIIIAKYSLDIKIYVLFYITLFPLVKRETKP